MTLACILCAIAGFALFGLAVDTHHQRRLRARPSRFRQRRMRAAAWAMIALAFVPAIASAGWVFGPILWVGAIMLGAAVVFLTLNFVPVAK
jgi:hypothetical protein